MLSSLRDRIFLAEFHVKISWCLRNSRVFTQIGGYGAVSMRKEREMDDSFCGPL